MESESGMEIRADNWADYRGMDSPFLDLLTDPFFGFCYGLLRLSVDRQEL